jgi:redox-sensitive bicupin YhaK (pirin superfamily)
VDLTELLPITQDTRILSGIFTEDFVQELVRLRKYYAYIVQGSGKIDDYAYGEGDGFAISDESVLKLFTTNTELLLFDLR